MQTVTIRQRKEAAPAARKRLRVKTKTQQSTKSSTIRRPASRQNDFSVSLPVKVVSRNTGKKGQYILNSDKKFIIGLAEKKHPDYKGIIDTIVQQLQKSVQISFYARSL